MRSPRHYKKETYQKAYGGFALAGIFIFVGILALVFSFRNINFIGLHSWGFWLFIPAFFIILGSIHQYYINKQYQKNVLNAILQRGNQGIHKLEDIAYEVSLEPNEVIRVLVDLRNQGKVKYRFKSDSGELILGESITYSPSEQYVPSTKKDKAPLTLKDKGFCPYCGQELESKASFCPNCGSQLT